MKGVLVVALGFLILPGSIYMLLAANFGALKGYLIAATAFFGFLMVLSATWLFGLPGTPALTGPKGEEPSFVEFTAEDPAADRFAAVSQFQGQAGGVWQAAPGGEVPPDQEQLKADLDTARQAAVSGFISEHNEDVTDTSQEVDVINLDPKSFYTTEDGTTVAAITISPKTPPEGSGLQRPEFQPVTVFAYRDPGAPYLPSILFLGGSVALFAIHLGLLSAVERRQPLGRALAPGEPPSQARTPART